MTDPETLTPEQRVVYIRQLQRTVLFWQSAYARAIGSSMSELFGTLRAQWSKSRDVKDTPFDREYECDWIGPVAGMTTGKSAVS